MDGRWLAPLLACLQFDIGDKPATEASRDAAYQLGREGGDQKLMAWSYELEAGKGRRTVQLSHAVLRIALSQAEAWRLVRRNVAKLVEGPGSKAAGRLALRWQDVNLRDGTVLVLN